MIVLFIFLIGSHFGIGVTLFALGLLAMKYVEHGSAVFNEFGNRFILALLSKGEELNPWLAPRI